MPVRVATLIATLATTTVAAAQTPEATGPTPELFGEIETLYDELEYGRVVTLSQILLTRPDTTPEMLETTYLMLGSSHAAVGDPTEAETPFRLLLRLRPDFEMPESTSPKILAVFRLVQTEERKIAERVATLEREKLLASLQLEGAPPVTVTGGTPIRFSYRLRDPRGVVDGVSVRFRRQRDPAFSALALTLGPDNRWHGELPGEWSNNEGGFTLEYFVATADNTGSDLITMASQHDPIAVAVTPGEAGELVLYEEWWFWTIVGVVAIGGTISAVMIYDQSVKLPLSDHIQRIP